MENFEEITRNEDPTEETQEEVTMTNEPASARKKVQKGPTKWTAADAAVHFNVSF